MELTDLLLDLISPFLNSFDFFLLSKINTYFNKLASLKRYWKVLLSEEYNLPLQILNHPICDVDQTVFKKIFAKLNKYYYLDILTFNRHLSAFKNPIFMLAFLGSLPLLKNYLEKNENHLTLLDDNGWNLLHYAALSENLDCFQFLLNKNLKLTTENDDYWNLLHSAGLSGNLSIIKEVIKRDQFAIGSRDSQNRNILYLAVLNNNFATVKYLMSFQELSIASISLITKMNMLHIAASKGNKEIFLLFAETNQYDFEDVDCFHRNVLHHAYLGKNKEICNYLIQKTHFKLNRKDQLGCLPHQYENGTPGIQKLSFWDRRKLLRLKDASHLNVISDDQETRFKQSP